VRLFNYLFIIQLFIGGTITSNCIGQNSIQLKSYKAKFVNALPIIDGRLDDIAWKNAMWANDFEDIQGAGQKKPKFKTKFKLIWDNEFLYIGAFLQEPNLWASQVKRDDIVYRDHDFEIFLDPNNDGENYFEFEINALGTLMDLKMTKPYKKGGTYSLNWNAEGTKSAVYCDGTLNNNTDKDKGWYVEMAIPFKALQLPNRNFLPLQDQPWRINFSRVEWNVEPMNTTYTKVLGSNNKPIPEYNWVWSPTGVIDIHLPNKWGNLYFIK